MHSRGNARGSLRSTSNHSKMSISSKNSDGGHNLLNKLARRIRLNDSQEIHDESHINRHYTQNSGSNANSGSNGSGSMGSKGSGGTHNLISNALFQGSANS